ncbi:MAG: hypothetical protein IT306_12305 [Chloroflexi bacterium]|nr:hypothetical protein [Chloroflexota bacterium]
MSGFRTLQDWQRLDAALAVTVVTALAVWWLAYPALPSGGVVAAGDATFVATNAQLQQGVYIVLPNVTQKPSGVSTIPFGPFMTDPPTRTELAPGEVSSVRLALQPGQAAAVGEQLAAVALVGEANRKLTARVADAPGLPIAVVLAGIWFGWLVSWAQGRWRPAQDERARCLLALENLHDDEPRTGDIDTDGAADFTIGALADRVIGVGASAAPESALAAIGDGDLAAARERRTAAETLYRTFEALCHDARELYATHRRLFPTVETDAPLVAQLTEALLKRDGKPLVFDDEQSLADTQEQVQLLTALYDVYGRVERRQQEAVLLLGALQQAAAGWADQEDIEKLAAAEYLLSTVDADLAAATRTADVSAWKVEERLEGVVTSLRTVRAKYPTGVYVSSSSSPPPPLLPATVRHADLLAPRVNIQSASETAASLREQIDSLDWSLTMLGVVLAAVTAISYLYVGKPFGTPFDYALAFFWGLGVDQSLKGLAAILGKLGVSSALTTK